MTKPTALYRLDLPAYSFVPPQPHFQKKIESAQQDTRTVLKCFLTKGDTYLMYIVRCIMNLPCCFCIQVVQFMKHTNGFSSNSFTSIITFSTNLKWCLICVFFITKYKSMLIHETIEFDVAHPVSPYRYVLPLFNSQPNMVFRNVSFH